MRCIGWLFPICDVKPSTTKCYRIWRHGYSDLSVHVPDSRILYSSVLRNSGARRGGNSRTVPSSQKQSGSRESLDFLQCKSWQSLGSGLQEFGKPKLLWLTFLLIVCPDIFFTCSPPSQYSTKKQRLIDSYFVSLFQDLNTTKCVEGYLFMLPTHCCYNRELV